MLNSSNQNWSVLGPGSDKTLVIEPVTMIYLMHFYTAIIESDLCSSNLPSLQDVFASRTLKRAMRIVADFFQPGQKLYLSLSSGRRLKSIRNKTSNSFLDYTTLKIFHQPPLLTAIILLYRYYIILTCE